MDERSPKRVRLEGPVEAPFDVLDDDTDFYSESNSPEKKDQHALSGATSVHISSVSITTAQESGSMSLSGTIPGLGAPNTSTVYSKLSSIQRDSGVTIGGSNKIEVEEIRDGTSLEDSDFDLYTPQDTDSPSKNPSLHREAEPLTENGHHEDTKHVMMVYDASNALQSTNSIVEEEMSGVQGEEKEDEDLYFQTGSEALEEKDSTPQNLLMVEADTTEQIEQQAIEEPSAKGGAVRDPALSNEQFLEAAQASRDNKSAEWRFDPSDAESDGSSGSDTTSGESDEDSDDDSSSEDEGLLLDPEEQARILMQETAEGDGAGNSDMPPRTENEQVERYIPKPDIVVTPEMAVTKLGVVDHIIDFVAVIKADVSGEFKVLDAGSVLCLEDRTVIGAIAETLGPVRKPLYTVAFTNEADLEECKTSTGTTVYYVDDHSSYVFTKPLQLVKGSDASNVHDEEIAYDDVEFSDDEKEAEYKRSLKQAKLAKRQGDNVESNTTTITSNDKGGNRGGRQGSRGSHQPSSPHHKKVHPDSTMTATSSISINYDDGDEDDNNDDMYQPLRRPDNLQELMAAGPPQLPRLNRGDFRRDGPRRGGFSGNASTFRGGFGGRDRQARGRGGKFPGGRHGYDGDSSRNAYGGDRGRPQRSFSSQRKSGSKYNQTAPQQTQDERHGKQKQESHRNAPPPSQREQGSDMKYSPVPSQPRSEASTYATNYAPPPQSTPSNLATTPQTLPAGTHINPAFVMLQNLLQTAATTSPQAASPNPLNAFQQYMQPQQQAVAAPHGAAINAQLLNNPQVVATLLQQYQQPVQSPGATNPSPQASWPGYNSQSQGMQGLQNQAGFRTSGTGPQSEEQEGREAQERLRLLVESFRGQGGAGWGQHNKF
jgi:H/ACA ribonucleoprotein complex non-core subunit NAF1